MAGDPGPENPNRPAARSKTTLPADDGKWFRMSRLGFDFVATVIACAFAGWLIDREFGCQPWGLLAMLMVGFFAGIRNVWRGLDAFDPASQGNGKK